jgi:hypothetical protein
VHRSEIAQRVSYYTPDILKQVCNKWFTNGKPCIAAYGPARSLIDSTSYKTMKLNKYVSDLVKDVKI